MTLEHKPIRVLLVDNSLAMLWGLGKLIQGEFPRMMLIGTACTDGEALLYAYLRPDVVVLDIDLDGYSSIEIIPALKARSGGGVLVHTGLSDRRLHEDAMLFGAMGVLGKDAPAALLIEAVERVHAGRSCHFDPAVIAAASTPDSAVAGGAERLSRAERDLIADLAERWQSPLRGASRMPLALAQIVALYDKLGLKNRIELARFAVAHAIVGPDHELSRT